MTRKARMRGRTPWTAATWQQRAAIQAAPRAQQVRTCTHAIRSNSCTAFATSQPARAQRARRMLSTSWLYIQRMHAGHMRIVAPADTCALMADGPAHCACIGQHHVARSPGQGPGVQRVHACTSYSQGGVPSTCGVALRLYIPRPNHLSSADPTDNSIPAACLEKGSVLTHK